MPSFSDWLKASWDDFRRRWGVLMAVAGVSGAAALAGGFAPFVPAALLTASGVGPAWAVWGLASIAAVLAALWLSTWAQAAVTLAAMTELPAGECLAQGWKRTGAFAWVLSLALVATCGAYFLFIIPGLLLSVLLFFGAFICMSGEAEGERALALSWARVRPRFGAVSARVVAAGLLAAAPGWIPGVGWIIAMFWAPFGVVALARVAKDLRAADPEPALPPRFGAALAGLAAVFAVGGALSCFLAVRAVSETMRTFNDPGGLASRLRPETAQELTGLLTGQGSDEDKKKAYDDLLSDLRKPAP
jgi:hypothetical protein